jgi:hypothetical protein
MTHTIEKGLLDQKKLDKFATIYNVEIKGSYYKLTNKENDTIKL